MFFEDLIFIAPEKGLLNNAKGNYARPILVCNLEEPDYPQNKGFLEKILTAAKINLDNDALYVEHNTLEPLALLPALKAKKPLQILVFGFEPKQLGLNLQVRQYQAFEFYGATFLFSEKLSLLENDRDRKGQLWTALKVMFL